MTKYGYVAAILTTLIRYAVFLAIMVVASWKYLVLNFSFRSLGQGLYEIIMAAAYAVGNSQTSSLMWNLAAAISIGLLLYLALLLLRE